MTTKDDNWIYKKRLSNLNGYYMNESTDTWKTWKSEKSIIKNNDNWIYEQIPDTTPSRFHR